MKFLIGFIFAAPMWFVLLITANALYLTVIGWFGPEVRIGYWFGVAIAGFSAAVQALLLMLMLELHGKKWNGEAWVI